MGEVEDGRVKDGRVLSLEKADVANCKSELGLRTEDHP